MRFLKGGSFLGSFLVLGAVCLGVASCGSNKSGSPAGGGDGGGDATSSDGGEAGTDGGDAAEAETDGPTGNANDASDAGATFDASDGDATRATDATDTGATDAGDAAEGASDAGADSDAGPAETGAPDAQPDAPDSSRCNGVMCAGQCLQASDCRGCTGAPLLCAPTGTCTSACAGCQDSADAALPVQCFACDSTHNNPIGTCQPANPGSYCLSGDYTGQYRGGQGYQCECQASTDCPGASQVCVPLGLQGAAFCLTCGEPTIGAIQGQPCKGGGICQEGMAACQ